MSMAHSGRAALAALLLTSVGVSVAGMPASAARAAASASLGSCWLTKLGLGLGEDINAVDYVARWRGGAIQTVVQGVAPQARYWSLTLYHAQRGKMVTYYDAQISKPGSSYTVTIGGARASKGLYIDPASGGGDSAGYLFLRVYKISGKMTLPTITYSSKAALPSSLTSCSAMTSEVRSALVAADKKRPANGKTVGQTAKRSLWPNNASPYRIWSQTVNPALSVPTGDVSTVPLITQVADPNVTYHAVFFNLSWGDMVLHGTIPTISNQAPNSGMRYVSMCAYPTDQSRAPLACLDDKAIKTDSKGQFVMVVSPDQPSDTSNWLNPGDVQVGAVILRWVLPQGGAKAKFCLPALEYRQPGDTTVPALPAGC